MCQYTSESREKILQRNPINVVCLVKFCLLYRSKLFVCNQSVKAFAYYINICVPKKTNNERASYYKVFGKIFSQHTYMQLYKSIQEKNN